MFQMKNKLFPLAALEFEKIKENVPLAGNSVTLVKIYFFFYSWLLLVSVTVSTTRKSL